MKKYWIIGYCIVSLVILNNSNSDFLKLLVLAIPFIGVPSWILWWILSGTINLAEGKHGSPAFNRTVELLGEYGKLTGASSAAPSVSENDPTLLGIKNELIVFLKENPVIGTALLKKLHDYYRAHGTETISPHQLGAWIGLIQLMPECRNMNIPVFGLIQRYIKEHPVKSGMAIQYANSVLSGRMGGSTPLSFPEVLRLLAMLNFID